MNPTQLQLPDTRMSLAQLHARSLEEVRRHLTPACDPHAGFWDRRAATSFLRDHFASTLRLEGKFLDTLLGRLDPQVAGRLVDDQRSVDRLLADFEELAPQRGSAIAAAAIACSLLATLQRWYSELESAVRALPPENIRAEARELLARFEDSNS